MPLESNRLSVPGNNGVSNYGNGLYKKVMIDLIGGLPMPAFAIDANSKLMAFNPDMEELTGYKMEEAIKIGIATIIDPATTIKESAVMEAFKNGETVDVDRAELCPKTGKPRMVAVRLKPVIGEDGNMLAIMAASSRSMPRN